MIIVPNLWHCSVCDHAFTTKQAKTDTMSENSLKLCPNDNAPLGAVFIPNGFRYETRRMSGGWAAWQSGTEDTPVTANSQPDAILALLRSKL